VETIDDFARETTATVGKYLALFEQVQDVASAERAATEMGNLAAELRALTSALPSIPNDPQRDGEVAKQLAELSFQLNTKDSARVMANPQLNAKVNAPATQFLRFWNALLAEVRRRLRSANSKSPEQPR